MWFREACAAVLVFGLVASFRFLSLTGFPDDHYVHVAGAQQMLYGEWPTLDFVDLGAPLTYSLSAGAQVVIGRGMLAEAVLVAAMFAAAAVITLRAGVVLTGSVLLALAAVAIEVLILPRSYSDTKMLVYALAVLALAGYTRRPSMARLVALAVLVAGAFLIRHDHGVYVGVASAVAVVVSPLPVSRQRALRTAALFGGLVVLLTLPYLLYLESADGVVAHIRRGMAFAELEVPRQRLSVVGLRPEVAWLLYTIWLVPAAALAVVGLALANRTATARETARLIAPVAVLALVVNAGLIRDALDARLADAVVAPAILLAWLARQAWRPSRPTVAWAARIVAVSMLAVTVGSDAVRGRTAEQINRAGVFSRSRDFTREFATRARELQRPFEGRQTPSAVAGQMSPFFDYARRCLGERDSVLVPGFLPEVAVLARRPFAGGQVWFMPGALTTAYDHRLVMTRLSKQRVPVAVLRRPTYDELAREFPELDAYISGRFDPIAEWPLGGSDRVQLLGDRHLVKGRDLATGWPCFA